MSIAATLEQIERKMAVHKATIDAINERIAPVDAEIDALLEQQQAIGRQIDALVPKLAEARGMPADQYLALKREYGQLASTRMQLRSMRGALE